MQILTYIQVVRAKFTVSPWVSSFLTWKLAVGPLNSSFSLISSTQSSIHTCKESIIYIKIFKMPVKYFKPFTNLFEEGVGVHISCLKENEQL